MIGRADLRSSVWRCESSSLYGGRALERQGDRFGK